MKKMYIFSLGNLDQDGKVKYKYTRHNAARLVCDAFDFEKYNQKYKFKISVKDMIIQRSETEVTKENGVVKESEIDFIHVVPDCFMNESGKFILDYVRYKNINIDQVVIVYDDIDLNVGDIKLSHARNSGGHNGVESVIQKLNTKDFYRIRVGIGGKPVKEMLLQDYVLSKLSEIEIELFTFKNIIKNKIEIENKEETKKVDMVDMVDIRNIDLEKKFIEKLDELKMLVK